MSSDLRGERSGHPDREAGFTLIELLLAIVIMGLAVVTVVTSMGVAASGSDQQRQQVDVGLALTNAAEAIQNTTFSSTACTGPFAPYSTAATGSAVPPDWSVGSNPVSVSSVDCSSLSSSNLQVINLSVTSPNGRASGTLTIVKRNPA